MLEPPADLRDATLVEAIASDYGLPISSLTFLPLGHDASAWVYRAATSDGRDVFVKVRTAMANEAALAVPHHIRALGLDGVVAPLATFNGRLWTTASHYAVIVYPFVSGATAMAGGMSDEQWVEYGRLLRLVHDTTVDPDLESFLRRDDFRPDWANALWHVDEFLAAEQDIQRSQQPVARFWRTNRGLILDMLARAEQLGREVALSGPSLVLCHADIHTNNVLVGEDGRIWFVDWDETMLAPRERDLMFAVGGIHRSFVDDRQTQLFLDGYGVVDIDAVALAYYRYSWAISDIASYAEQVFFRPELGAVNQAEAVSRFFSLFEPGSIVEIAASSHA